MLISGWLADLCAAVLAPWAHVELTKAVVFLDFPLCSKASKSWYLVKVPVCFLKLFVFAWAHMELTKP